MTSFILIFNMFSLLSYSSCGHNMSYSTKVIVVIDPEKTCLYSKPSCCGMNVNGDYEVNKKIPSLKVFVDVCVKRG